MKSKLLIFLTLISFGSFAQNRMYNLTTQFDSVKVKKLLMTSILEGGVNDSVLVKKANGGLFKVARSSFGGGGSGSVTNFSSTDGFGIISSVTNPTTTPNYLSRVDSTVVTSISRFLTAMSLKANKDAPVFTSSFQSIGNMILGGTVANTTPRISLYNSAGAERGYLTYDGTQFYIGTPTSFPLKLVTNGATRVSIHETTGFVSFANGLVFTTTPTASGGAYSILTRNTSTGVMEQIASNTFVPTSRQILAGYGISGGGTLTTDRTFAVDTTAVRTVLNSYTKAQTDAKFLNYVDLTTNQTVAGNKTWTGDIQTFSGLGARFDQNAYFKQRSSVNPITGYGIISTNSDNMWFFSSQSGTNRSFYLVPPTTGTGYAQLKAEGSSVAPKIVAWTSDIPTLSNYTGSGDGASTTIAIPHGLTGITASSAVIVGARNAASAGISYWTSDATNINIFYTVAPVSGASNLSYTISIKP